MVIVKTVCRTVFYQFFLLFVGLSIGFIVNVEYVGVTSPILFNSYNNIFNRVQFDDPGVLEWLYGIGQFKLYAFENRPENFEVIEEAMCAEEWYWCKYRYTENGEEKINIKSLRIRWKPWEYYWDAQTEPWSHEDMVEYLNGGSLNSTETDKAFRLRDEMRDMINNKKKEEENEKVRIIKPSFSIWDLI